MRVFNRSAWNLRLAWHGRAERSPDLKSRTEALARATEGEDSTEAINRAVHGLPADHAFTDAAAASLR